MNEIRWDLVAEALAAYRRSGFRYVEVPWIVEARYNAVTLPEGKRAFETLGGVLVGSAEQSFIQMMEKHALGPGDYVAASPCFRDEQDETHQTAFFKVELIRIYEAGRAVNAHGESYVMAERALKVFHALGALGAEIVQTRDGYDVELGGLEIGSYGYREWDGRKWTYGTGIAEPRFSMAAART